MTTMMSGDVMDVNVEDFIKTFTASDSPARGFGCSPARGFGWSPARGFGCSPARNFGQTPTRFGRDRSNHNLDSNNNHSGAHQASSPFDHSFHLADLSGSTTSGSSEWLTNGMGGFDSGFAVSTPSSRGSSLETPALSQSATFGIDPARLKDTGLNSFEPAYDPNTERIHSPVWTMSQPMSQPMSTQHPTPISVSVPLAVPEPPEAPEPVDTVEAVEVVETLLFDEQQSQQQQYAQAQAQTQPRGTIRKRTEMEGLNLAPTPTSTTPPSSKRKRQGSLPELHIQVAPAPTSRVFQRSVSSGTIATFELHGTNQSNEGSPWLGGSPVTAPLSAPPVSQHQQSFTYKPMVATTAMPQTTTQHTRAFSHGVSHGGSLGTLGALATIPETPNSAPPDVQQWPMDQQQLQPHHQQFPPEHQQHQQQHQQHQYEQQQQQYHPQPQQQHEQHQHQHDQHQHQAQHHHQLQHQLQAQPQATALGVNTMPDMSGYTMPQPPTTPSLPPSAQNSPMIPIAPSLPQTMQSGQRPPSSSGLPQRPASHQGVAEQQASAARLSTQPRMQPMHMRHMSMIQQSTGGLGLGMGRPTPPHMRRSSDSELAFAMGPTNVGAMLRSSSVPQAPGQMARQGSAMFTAQALPPPPPVTTYTAVPGQGVVAYPAEMFVPANGHNHAAMNHMMYGIGSGVPMTVSRSGSPPRKRVSSKRVGTCLKPGPKGKPKIKAEDAGMIKPEPVADHAPKDIGPPVTLAEFRSAFDRTPAGNLVPKPAMNQLIERLMYATEEAVVDACFRWCYAVGTEFNHAAEKQSKFFKCSFEECAGSSQRIFMRKSAVDSHVRTHVGYRPFKCEADPECDARFVRKHDRDRHVATTHRNEKSFLCTDCGQNFARSDALLRHRAKRDACKARMG